MHYQRWRTLGDPGEAAPRFLRKATSEERFWRFVDRRGPKDCWPWTGALSGGYGAFKAKGWRGGNAYRFAYELLVGPVPKGKELDHLCRNRACVNPAHLEAVTPKENKLRGIGTAARNSRKTHCVNGHPLGGPDALLKPDPIRKRRICRLCVREARRRRYQRLGR